MQPFYIGQEVVALDNGEQSGLVEGKTYVILGLLKPCGHWMVDVGIKSPGKGMNCPKCHTEFAMGTGIFWLFATRFAPITSQFQTISYSKVMEKESPFVGAN